MKRQIRKRLIFRGWCAQEGIPAIPYKAYMESEIAKIRHDREVCETVKLLHPRIWASLSLEDRRILADIIEGRIDKRTVDKALRRLHTEAA